MTGDVALSAAPLFADFDRGELVLLEGIARPIVLETDIVVYEEGATNRSLYFIRRGEVRVTRRFKDHESELALLGAGQTFGEMSLLGDGITTATITTARDAELLVLDREELERLFELQPRLAARFWHTIAVELGNRLAHANDAVVSYAEVNRAMIDNPRMREFYASCLR